jgi:hypothetical protein
MHSPGGVSLLVTPQSRITRCREYPIQAWYHHFDGLSIGPVSNVNWQGHCLPEGQGPFRIGP